MLLFTPGPTNIPAAVRQMLADDVVSHRTASFWGEFASFSRNLQTIFDTRFPVVTIAGSGTAGLEAAITNLFDQRDKVIVLVNGFFGSRIHEMLTHQRCDVFLVESPWGEPFNLDQLKEILADNPDVRGVMFSLVDMSTGVLNQVAPVSAILKDYPQALLVVDTISGAPLNAIKFDELKIDCAIAASQLGFMLPPGLAFLALSQKAIARVNSTSRPRDYFDLRQYLRYLGNGPQTPYTPPVNIIHAGNYAVQEILEQGLAVYREKAMKIRDFFVRELGELGFKPLIDISRASNSVLSFYVPEGIDAYRLKVHLMEQDKIAIETGMLHQKASVVRLGFMSNLSVREAKQLVDAITDYLAQQKL